MKGSQALLAYRDPYLIIQTFPDVVDCVDSNDISLLTDVR